MMTMTVVRVSSENTMMTEMTRTMTNYRIYSEPVLNPTYLVLEVDGQVVRRKYLADFERPFVAWWWNFRIKCGWKPASDMYSGKIK
jgi:hypothetical protein